MARNYKKEYDNYHSKPEQKKRRAGRNTARNRAMAKGKVKKGDGKDVHHLNNDPTDNNPDNLKVKKQENNRSFPRTAKARRKR